MDGSLDLGPINVRCEFDEDSLKTLLCRVNTRKNKVGPLVATNVTNGW